jgi:putative thioredoxin
MNTLAPAHIATVNASNAQDLLITESQHRLVAAVFWAEQSPESLQLITIIERIANEYDGDFLLAKVDVAQHRAIAQQLGIQAIPTIMLIQNGQPVDGLTGTQTEGEIRNLLDNYLPKPWDKQVTAAQQLINEQQLPEALALLRQAYSDSQQRPDIALILANLYLQMHRIDEAEALISTIPIAEQNVLYQQIKAQITLQRSADNTPEVDALEQALALTPDDLTLKTQLAVQFQHEHQTRKALELLIAVMRTDKQFNNGEAKKLMLDIFKSLGTSDPLVTEFQRQLFALLY